jgi:L-ascorbate metabolism protein UlaG (beta-lactamase superfamily)
MAVSFGHYGEQSQLTRDVETCCGLSRGTCYVSPMAQPCVLALATIVALGCACSKHEVTKPGAAASVASPLTSAAIGLASAAPADTPIVIPPNWPHDELQTSKGPLTIIPIHHGSVLFVHDNKAIYVDPTSEGYYEGLPKANFIFVTHAHPDHLDPKQISKLKGPNTSIVTAPEIGRTVGAQWILKNGESRLFGSFTVQAVPAYNTVRGPEPGKLYHPKGEGNGYLFTFGGKRVYVSGDTECALEIKALRDIDIAFVCMRLPYTMPPSEAAECIKAFQPKVVYPYHYQGSNLDELKNALKSERGIELRVRDWYRNGPPPNESPLAKMLPDRAGPFIAAPLKSEPEFVRREYSRGRTKISVTIAVAGAASITFDEWLKMSGTSPAVSLDAPANSAAGFYDCAGPGVDASCNVHIHFRVGYHLELMGEGKARRGDFDALLKALPIRRLAQLPPG